MSKEEFLKIQTCVLKVNIHCDGCKQKVKKILQKIDGVYTTKIDSEQGKVTVSGNVDPATLIKKLTKNGKHAEIWGAPKPTNNNQFKNPQIDNGKGGNNNKGQVQKNGGNNNQPKVVLPQLQNPQMKGIQDLKLPPQFMKDIKMPLLNMSKDQNQKGFKLNVAEDVGLSDDEYDDDDLDDEYDDDDLDDEDDLEDELDALPPSKMKPMMGNGSQMPPNMLMTNMLNGQNPQQMIKGGPIGGANGAINIGNAKKVPAGGGGNIPVQMNLGGGKGGPNGGNKGGAPPQNGGNQNQGGGKGGKNGSGPPPQQNGGQNKNGVGGGGGAGGVPNINNFIANGAKKWGGMNDGPLSMPNMMSMNAAGGGVGQMGHTPMNHMGSLPMGQMNNLSVHGMPAMNGGGGLGGAGHYQGGRPEQMPGNPYYQQQQLAAMMMNQQHANGNERFQPMMYARPPPAINYMPPYPPYPYPPPPGERADQYSMFSDENTSSCTVM